MALNLQSLSITSAFNAILNYFQSAENQTAWRDLSSSSEGTFLSRLLANVMSNISYRIIAQSRENYLSTAALTSSNIGIAVNLGYSAFRGSNLKRLIEITPTGDYTFPALSVIGTYSDDYDIICLEDTSLETGVATTVKTVVGKIKEETVTVGTSALRVFSLFTTGISEDYTLYLGSTQVPTTDVIKEMTDDKYLVRTNPYSSVDIMYLNNATGAQYKYGTGSEITIRYVELADVPVKPYTDDMITYGTLTNATNISTYLPFESVEEIKVNAPLDHETQNLIRSKQDYANRLQQILHAETDVNFKALTPTYTLLSYLKNDFTLLTDTEIAGVQELLKEENYFGTPLPDITVPRREVAKLQISLKLNTKYKNISDIQLDIENILESYYNSKLQMTFNTFDLERKIEDLSYVKYARVSHVINTRDADTNYQVGYILYKDDQYYIASKILGLSGSSAPSWNIPVTPPEGIDTGLETEDGSLVWRAYKKLPNMTTGNLTTWRSNMQYGIGDYVVDANIATGYMFKCVDIKKMSGLTEPATAATAAGDFIADGGVVWVAKERSDTYDSWTSSTTYRLGSSVNVTTNTGISLECIGYTGTTGSETESTFDFELPIYDILATTENTFTVAGNKTFYFSPDDIISASYSGGTTAFTVVSSVYNGTNTIVTVATEIDTTKGYTKLYTAEKGTKDGQVLWMLVDDITNITYPWNGYVVFDYEVDLLD